MDRRQLNDVYKELDKKARDISKLLGCTFAYFNGHYSLNESGEYETDYFPIPVLSLKGVCDIEIGLDLISVTAKLTKERAITFDFEKIKSYNFEAYGEENYLDDFFVGGDTIESMLEKIKNSKEKNIVFSFAFQSNTDSCALSEFVNFIKSEGFFY